MSWARRTVECALGMLTQKFGILKPSMETCTKVSAAIVKSICVYHNFIHHKNNISFRGDNDGTIDDQRQNVRSLSPTRSPSPTAKEMLVQILWKITLYHQVELLRGKTHWFIDCLDTVYKLYIVDRSRRNGRIFVALTHLLFTGIYSICRIFLFSIFLVNATAMVIFSLLLSLFTLVVSMISDREESVKINIHCFIMLLSVFFHIIIVMSSVYY